MTCPSMPGRWNRGRSNCDRREAQREGESYWPRPSGRNWPAFGRRSAEAGTEKDPASCVSGVQRWRRGAELNRCKRFCRPLPNHSATPPNTSTDEPTPHQVYACPMAAAPCRAAAAYARSPGLRRWRPRRWRACVRRAPKIPDRIRRTRLVFRRPWTLSICSGTRFNGACRRRSLSSPAHWSDTSRSSSSRRCRIRSASRRCAAWSSGR
jgi:hypothetical protein